MFGSDGRCPRCGGTQLWQSKTGWLKFPARMISLYPLRCDHCTNRFWRFVWAPPPTVVRRARPGGHQRVRPNGDLDTPPG